MSKKSKQRKLEREKTKKAKGETLEAKETLEVIKEDDGIENTPEKSKKDKAFPESNEQEEKEDIFLEGKSIDAIIEEGIEEKKEKNYTAIIVLLLGALLGSLFVDVAQLLSKKGYSAKALRTANVFTMEDKTWVAYSEPIVTLNIVTVSEDKMAECPTCKPPVEVIDLFKKVMPTLAIKEVDVESEEGKRMVVENNIKVLPAIIFSDSLTRTEFYEGEAKVLFSKIEASDNYLLSLTGIGLPIGKYIEVPKINDTDPILGNKESAVKIILFSDHQCPFCAKSFKEVVNLTKSFGDKVALVYKDLPLEFHPQAMNASMAGACANDQDKFWEMSVRLYATQKQWGNLSDEKAIVFFKRQALNLKLDIEKFGTCLDNAEHKDEIAASKKEAEDFGINGTPSMFIGDEFVGGAIPIGQLKATIQSKIDALEQSVEVTNEDTNNAENKEGK